MRSLAIIALVVVATVLAGRHGKKGKKWVPESCAKIYKEHTDCLTTEKDKITPPLDFTMKDVKECIKDCPRKERQRGRGPPRKGFWRSMSEEDKQKLKDFHECKAEAKKATMFSCVQQKMGSVQVEELDKSNHPLAGMMPPKRHRRGRGRHGGKGKGGKCRGGKNMVMKMAARMKKRMTCTPEVEACVREEVGDWMDKSPMDALKAVCGVLEACPRPEKSEQCKTDKKALKKAKCECLSENQDAFMTELDKCMTKLPESIQEMAERKKEQKMQHYKERCNQILSGDDDDDDSKEDKKREHKLPGFCRMDECEDDSGDE